MLCESSACGTKPAKDNALNVLGAKSGSRLQATRVVAFLQQVVLPFYLLSFGSELVDCGGISIFFRAFGWNPIAAGAMTLSRDFR